MRFGAHHWVIIIAELRDVVRSIRVPVLHKIAHRCGAAVAVGIQISLRFHREPLPSVSMRDEDVYVILSIVSDLYPEITRVDCDISCCYIRGAAAPGDLDPRVGSI